MRSRVPWVLLGIVAAAAITVVLNLNPDPYPMSAGPGASQSSPIAVGKAVPAVVEYIEPKPGDRFQLISAEPVGLIAGAKITFYVSRAVVKDDGTRVIGEALEPLAGAVIETPAGASPGPENAVGIVAEVTPDQPGIFELTAVRLHFRLNGGGEQTREGISVVLTVCADHPAPTDCVSATPES